MSTSKSLASTTTLKLESTELPSHCIVTVATGTNYAPELARGDIQTLLSLRFSGAYPIVIKGLKEAESFVGFELLLTGEDETGQLIAALETAAAQLRQQANLPAPAPPLAADAAWLGIEAVQLLASYGSCALPSGQTVGSYLLQELGELPFGVSEAVAEIWQLCSAAQGQGQLPGLEEIRAQVSPAAREVLLTCPPDLLDKWGRLTDQADQLQLECDGLLTRIFLADLFDYRSQAMQQLGAEGVPAEQNRQRVRRFQDNGRLEYKLSRLLAQDMALAVQAQEPAQG